MNNTYYKFISKNPNFINSCGCINQAFYINGHKNNVMYTFVLENFKSFVKSENPEFVSEGFLTITDLMTKIKELNIQPFK